MERRPLCLLLVLSVVLSFGFVGFESAAANDEPIVLSLGHWNAMDPAFLEMIDAFHAAQDRIRVEIRAYSWDEYSDGLVVENIAGVGPDIINIHGTQTPPAYWIQQGLLLDLTPYFERDKAELMVEDFIPQSLELTSLNGFRYAMPYCLPVPSALVVVNNDLFDALGLELPFEEWDWDDLRSLASKITRDADGDGATDTWAINLAEMRGWREVLHQAIISTGDWYFQNGDTEINLRTEGALRAMDWAYSLVEGGYVPLSGGNWTRTGMRMGMSWGFLVRGYYEGWWRGTRVSVVQTPKDPVTGQRGYEAGIMQLGFGISAHCKHPEAAWEFVKFATGPDGWAKAGYETGNLFFLPARQSLIMDYFVHSAQMLPAPVDPLAEARAGEYLQANVLASPNPNLMVSWAEIEKVLASEWTRVVQGIQGVEVFVERVTPLVNQILQQ